MWKVSCCGGFMEIFHRMFFSKKKKKTWNFLSSVRNDIRLNASMKKTLLKPVCTGIILLLPIPFLGHLQFCQTCVLACPTYLPKILLEVNSSPTFFFLLPWQAFPKLPIISIGPTLIMLILFFPPLILRKNLSFQSFE